MIVVAPRSAQGDVEVPAAVARALDRAPHHVHDVRVVRCDGDASEIAARERGIVVDELPGGTAVVRAIQAGLAPGRGGGREGRALDGDRGVHHRATAAARHGETDAAQRSGGKPSPLQAVPVRAAVIAFVDAGPGPGLRPEVVEPGMHPHLPQGGVDDGWMRGIRRQVHGAGRVIHRERVLPVLSPVGGEIDAPLGVGTKHVPQGPDQHPIGIAGIDEDSPDMPRGGEPDLGPRLAAVRRAVHAFPCHDVVACVHLAGAGVKNRGIGWGDGEGADCCGRFVLQLWVPGAAGVRGLPDPTSRAAEVERVRGSGDPRGHGRPPRAIWPHEPPAQDVRAVAVRPRPPRPPRPPGEQGRGQRYCQRHVDRRSYVTSLTRLSTRCV